MCNWFLDWTRCPATGMIIKCIRNVQPICFPITILAFESFIIFFFISRFVRRSPKNKLILFIMNKISAVLLIDFSAEFYYIHILCVIYAAAGKLTRETFDLRRHVVCILGVFVRGPRFPPVTSFDFSELWMNSLEIAGVMWLIRWFPAVTRRR